MSIYVPVCPPRVTIKAAFNGHKLPTTNKSFEGEGGGGDRGRGGGGGGGGDGGEGIGCVQDRFSVRSCLLSGLAVSLCVSLSVCLSVSRVFAHVSDNGHSVSLSVCHGQTQFVCALL